METRFSLASIFKLAGSPPVLLLALLLAAGILWNRSDRLLASPALTFPASTFPAATFPDAAGTPLPPKQSAPTPLPNDPTNRLPSPSPSPLVGSTGGSSDAITPVTTDPNQLVLSAVRQAVWGPSIYCRVQQTTNIYGQRALLIGELKSEALSNSPMRRLRYTARVAVGETAFDLLQVSDGRMMWTKSSPNSPPKRIILDQVLQSIPSSMQYPDTRPEVHLLLAVGGQAELLRGLYHRYNWYKAVSGKIGGADVWQLVGRLRTEPTRIAGNAPIDNMNSDIGSPSPNLPTEARLTLSRSTKLPYFPFIVEYFQRAAKSSTSKSPFELMSRIEFKDPSTEIQFSEKDFDRFNETVEEIKDETQDYLPTVRLSLEPFSRVNR
ncbi:MAG: hypothetical protein DWH99_00585 [Planctomycetota bacterium]|nr:MAG: hypothetical protein DWH99_00585 [Planctomycetota bacterium]